MGSFAGAGKIPMMQGTLFQWHISAGYGVDVNTKHQSSIPTPSSRPSINSKQELT